MKAKLGEALIYLFALAVFAVTAATFGLMVRGLLQVISEGSWWILAASFGGGAVVGVLMLAMANWMHKSLTVDLDYPLEEYPYWK